MIRSIRILKDYLILAAFFLSLLYCGMTESGQFSLRPSLIISEEYDDNIFLTKDAEEDDYITRVSPSIIMSYKTPLIDFQLDYTLYWWYYSELGEDENSHDLNLVSTVDIIKNFLAVDISDTYLSEVLDPRRPSTEVNFDINRTDTNNFQISPYTVYKITNTTELKLGYRYTNIWYRERIGTDRDMHTGYASIEKILSPRVNMSVGAEYTADRPEETQSDNDRTTAFFGVTRKISPRTEFEGKVGYNIINFSNMDDSDSIYYDAVLTYRFYESAQIELKGRNAVTNSPLYGILERRSEEVSIRFGDVLRITGGVFHREEEYLETEREDRVFGGTAVVEYKFNPRLTVAVSGIYEKHRFKPEDQDREIYAASANIAYLLMEKVSFILSYNYTEENADVSANEYRNNVTAVELRITM